MTNPISFVKKSVNQCCFCIPPMAANDDLITALCYSAILCYATNIQYSLFEMRICCCLIAFFKLWVSFSTFDVSGLILSSKLFVNSLSHGLWLCQSNTQANENQRLADNTTKGMSNSLEVCFPLLKITLLWQGSTLWYSSNDLPSYFYATGMSK